MSLFFSSPSYTTMSRSKSVLGFIRTEHASCCENNKRNIITNTLCQCRFCLIFAFKTRFVLFCLKTDNPSFFFFPQTSNLWTLPYLSVFFFFFCSWVSVPFRFTFLLVGMKYFHYNSQFPPYVSLQWVTPPALQAIYSPLPETSNPSWSRKLRGQP